MRTSFSFALRKPQFLAIPLMLTLLMGLAWKPAFAADKTLRVAHLELKGSYPENPQVAGLLGEVTENLPAILARLKRAASDEEIDAVVLRINRPSIGWGKLNELRAAVKRIQAKEKKVYAWFDGGSSMEYLLASACDEVIMPESAVLMLVGMRAEVGFYKNMLDMLDIQSDILRIGEYKSAAEPYSRSEMSPEFREELGAILDDYYAQTLEMIVAARKIKSEEAEAAIDSGPHTADEAKKLGLIDRVAYESDLKDLLKSEHKSAELKVTRKYGKKRLDTDFSGFAGMVKLMNLMMGVEPTRRRTIKPKIAVISASGPIMSGKSSSDLFGGETMGSETIIKAVRKASDDSTVKAIVLRVDSPGGSALASDLMWQQLEKVEKPFVVSMGNVAASGGYYISMGSDYIFAEPGTITGSIGVVGGKVALDGLYKKIGITTSVVSRGKNSGVLSTLNGFSESERAAMMKLLHSIYDQFTKKAAKGRQMEHDALEKLARGRIYTGRMAVENGLIDAIGTLDDAIAHAKKLANLKEDESIERLNLPKPVSPFEQLFGPIDPEANSRNGQVTAAAVLEVLGGFSPELKEQIQAFSVINLLARESRLTLMPFSLKIR